MSAIQGPARQNRSALVRPLRMLIEGPRVAHHVHHHFAAFRLEALTM
jgi:hypothetical protein